MNNEQFIIVLDAGHGGNDSGAVNGETGAMEKDVVLADSLLIGSMLEHAGMRVVQTRDSDEFLPLSESCLLYTSPSPRDRG